VKIKLLIALFCLNLVTVSGADDFIIYPEKGQSKEQIEQDKFACYTWAKEQTGFDPMEVPKATSAPPAQEQTRASATRGAVGGAAAGALIGEIADDKGGEGAVIGAVAGGLFGNMRRNKKEEENRQAQQQWANEQGQQYAAKRNTYNRAYVACLEGRNYSVK
jgi:hypothetical protein